MKDIAAACGFSIATVSKALNGHKDIGEETKKLIKKTAEEMGYFPNSSARALKSNRSYNFGVLFVDEARSGLTHDYFASILESFKLTAEKYGYDITFINANRQGKDRLSYLDWCRYKGVDGVVIACINFFDPEVIELVQSEIPIVTVDHIFNNNISVISDNIKGMADLVKYIYDCGHRKIAYIHGIDSSVTKARLSSFYKTTEELGLKIPDDYVREVPYRDTQATAIVTEELLNLKNNPSCIIFSDDFASIGGINVIKSKGFRIPQDISVAGYDGIQIMKFLDPLLTTINQDTKKMGQTAAEKLVELVEKPKTTIIEHIVIPGKLEKGNSVAVLDRKQKLTSKDTKKML
jgi:LacI family transcriptional regulator/LacI family purine nucleotide synthesis repressor